MKVTLDIPDGIICAFLTGVEISSKSVHMFSYQLKGSELVDGNTIKLPRERSNSDG